MKFLVDGQPLGAGGDDEEFDDETPEPFYGSVVEFVERQLAQLWRRQLDQSTVWCPEWWRHAEAITRLDALWRAWEHLRLEPALGISVWVRDHADHHMAVLLSTQGPFKYCDLEKGHSARLEPLPVLSPPTGLFGA